jgi:hypothetical protein
MDRPPGRLERVGGPALSDQRDTVSRGTRPAFSARLAAIRSRLDAAGALAR